MMPKAPLHPCAEPGCPTLVPRGQARCTSHQRPAWAGKRATGSNLDQGSTRRWRALRAKVLRRDPICRLCGQAPSAEVDHILPRAHGGGDDPANLRGLCRACHRRRSGQQGQEARRYG